MNSYMKEALSKPIVSPSNPVRDDLALLGLTRLAAGPVEPFHSLHYFKITGTSPHENIDPLDIARHNNAVARWWAHQKSRLTDADDEKDSSECESAWDNLSRSLESIAKRVSPAPSVKNLRLSSGAYTNPLKSCLKGPTTTHQSASTFSPDSSPTAERSGRRVVFNEIVIESIIADAPIIITGVQQDVGFTDIKKCPSFGDDWVHVPIHSVLGLNLGQENGSTQDRSTASLTPPLITVAPLTIKAIIPLNPVALYPPPRQEEIGVTVKFVPSTGMSSFKVEDLLPSERALRAVAEAKLARAVDRLYARYDREFMVGAISGGGGYLVDEELGMTAGGRIGRTREQKVILGSNSGEVKPGLSTARGKGTSMKREPTVRTYVSNGAKITPPNGFGINMTGTKKGNVVKDDVGDEGLANHEPGRGMVARVVRLTKGWIWRSG